MSVRIGMGAAALGGLGVTLLAFESWLRFAIGGTLRGVAPEVIAVGSAALLLLALTLCWRTRRVACVVVGVFLLQLLSSRAVTTDQAALYVLVNVSHEILPVVTLATGVLLLRSKNPVTVRWIGAACIVATLVWAAGLLPALPLEMLVAGKAATVFTLWVFLLLPANEKVRTWMRPPLESADIRQQ